MIFLDFSDVPLSDAAGGALPDGVFPVLVKSAAVVANEGKAPQIEFILTITDERYAGIERRTWIGLVPSEESKRKGLMQVWGAALMSIGVDAEQIKAIGRIDANEIPAIFTGREAYIEHTAGNQDAGTKTRINLIKPSAYEVRRAAQEANGGPVAAAPAAAPVVAAPVIPVQRTVQVPAAAAPVIPAAPVAAPAAAPTAGKPAGGLAALLRKK